MPPSNYVQFSVVIYCRLQGRGRFPGHCTAEFVSYQLWKLKYEPIFRIDLQVNRDCRKFGGRSTDQFRFLNLSNVLKEKTENVSVYVYSVVYQVVPYLLLLTEKQKFHFSIASYNLI